VPLAYPSNLDGFEQCCLFEFETESTFNGMWGHPSLQANLSEFQARCNWSVWMSVHPTLSQCGGFTLRHEESARCVNNSHFLMLGRLQASDEHGQWSFAGSIGVETCQLLALAFILRTVAQVQHGKLMVL